MKKLPGLFALLILFQPASSQPEPLTDIHRPPLTIYVNFLGEGSLLSVNAEKLLLNGRIVFLTGAAGVGFNNQLQLCLSGPCEENPNDFVTVPHHVTICIGKGAHYLEAGAGGTVVFGNTSQHYIPFPVAGYRLHPLQTRGFFLRLSFTYPLVRELEDIVWVPYGLSIGMSF
ncbi:MAG: hypothetical protein RBS37_02865 [Bacteroidales bacterium]|nr:hypothetical protein [Bacteroidales bacterium]